MAILNDLIVKGVSRFIGNIYGNLVGTINGFKHEKDLLTTSELTDTKNTAGSTDTSSKIFLIGATSQAANPQTYSHDTAYVNTDGKLHSNSKEVVNLSDTQALTNKTYNGYTLAAACAKGVVTSVDTSANLPTSNAVKTFVEGKGYITGHPTINAASSVTNIERSYVQDITLDSNGHVIGIESATETVTDTWNAMTGATSSANGTVGYVNAVPPKDGYNTKFLRADGSWSVPNYIANTDRYVNSASFADDTTANSSNPVKMTLTRAGSDTNTVTGNIPVVSSSSAGVAPKGEAVSTFNQSSKFLRSDGTWVAPKYTTNTNTYTSAYCDTAAGTAAKTATCTNYTLKNNTYLHVTIVYTNTSKTALTLNVNGKGAKTIYINGAVTSSSNYNLGAGTYLVFYDGTNYHFNTNGTIPASSQGWFCPCSDAANATTKTATTINADLFRLITGTIVAFRFANGHTASTLAININSTGAKPCAIGGYSSGDGDFALQLSGGSVATFMYINSNGGYYRFLGYTTKAPKDEPEIEMGTFNFTISGGGLHFLQSDNVNISRRDLVDTSTGTVYNGKGTDCPTGKDTVKAYYTKINDANGKSTIMIDEEFYVGGTTNANLTFTGLPATPATAVSSYMRYYPVYVTILDASNNSVYKTIIGKLTNSTSFTISDLGTPGSSCLIRIRTSYRSVI